MFVVIKKHEIFTQSTAFECDFQYIRRGSFMSPFMFLCHCWMITGVNCNLEKRLVLLSAFSEGFSFLFVFFLDTIMQFC